MAFKKSLEIFVSFNEDADMEDALDEAVKRIKAGNVFGHDKNESSRFNFSITMNISYKEA